MMNVLLKKNKLSHLDTRYNIKVSKIQNHLLKVLKEVHRDTERRLINFKVLGDNLENDLIIRDYAQKQTNISEARVKELEIMLYKKRIEISNSKCIQKKIQCKIKKCRETLYDVKYAAICALQVQLVKKNKNKKKKFKEDDNTIIHMMRTINYNFLQNLIFV